MTRLLWKEDSTLPDSYKIAKKRLLCTEKSGQRVIESLNTAIDDNMSKLYVLKLSPEEEAVPRE